MNIKNIVIVYDYAYINGGAAQVAIQSAIALTKQGFNVSYYAAVGPVCDELKYSKVNVTCLDIADINTGNRIKAIINGVWNSYASKCFKDYLIQFDNKDTIIHFHGWVKALSSSVIKYARKMGFKIVVTLHDYFTLCPNGGFYNYQTQKICELVPMSLKCVSCNCDKRNYLQKLWRVARQFIQDKIVRKSDDINYISISELCENVVKSYTVSEKFYRVRNPYDIDSAVVINAERNYNYIFIGRLSYEKGADIFCRAFSELIKNNEIRGQAIVVGDGEERKLLENSYDSITFIGWKNHNEIMKIIRNARALIFPSKWYETAGLTPIEAMACGVPCVISNCTAAKEYIDNEKNGFTFKSNNIESLKEKILLVEDDNIWSEICRSVRNNFDANNYSIESHMNTLIKVYEKIIY